MRPLTLAATGLDHWAVQQHAGLHAQDRGTAAARAPNAAPPAPGRRGRLREPSDRSPEDDSPSRGPGRGFWKYSTPSEAAVIGTVRPPGRGQPRVRWPAHASSRIAQVCTSRAGPDRFRRDSASSRNLQRQANLPLLARDVARLLSRRAATARSLRPRTAGAGHRQSGRPRLGSTATAPSSR